MEDKYDDKDLQRLYDKKYFSTRSRPPMWIRRAEFIVEKFHPETVLDIGCAYGELVKGLTNLGVEAYGIDGSDYAISNSDPTIRSKLFKVNLNSDPFPFENNTFDFRIPVPLRCPPALYFSLTHVNFPRSFCLQYG